MDIIVIVGSNHAGLAVANYLLSSKSDCEIILIDKNPEISFLGCGTSLLIKEEIFDPKFLFYADKEKISRKIKKLYMNTEVLTVNYATKTLICRKKSGDLFKVLYDKLVLATGSTQRMLNVPGNSLNNIFSLKTYLDTDAVVRTLKKEYIENVVIVGAGYIGIELAEAISKCKKRVYLLDSADRVLSMSYDPPFIDMTESILMENDIKLCLNQTPVKYSGKKRIEKVITNLSEFKADMVIQSLGFVPNSDLGGNQLMRGIQGIYLTNQFQQTNISDVYAVGDCASTYSNLLQETTVDYSVSNAIRSGYTAGRHLNGENFIPLGTQFTNGFKVFDYNFYSVGLNSKKAEFLEENIKCIDYEDYIKLGFMKRNNKIRLRILFLEESKKIIGAQFSSKENLSELVTVFSLAISKEITIDDFKTLDYLFNPYFSQPYNIILKSIIKNNF